MSKVAELYGVSTAQAGNDWRRLVSRQHCPFLGRRCVKTRKSQPSVTIGTCTVMYGREPQPIIICPHRLLERQQVFTDVLHLLTLHEPGNELHVVQEVEIPGGSVDYFLVSARSGKVRDFAGVELQTLDTTGTVWPARQQFLREANAKKSKAAGAVKGFGMNWKMTAKTTLIQLHHKTLTFEHLGKHLVLATQNVLTDYVRRESRFDHVKESRIGAPLHFHSYSLPQTQTGTYAMELVTRTSTDSAGVATCLGLKAEARVDLADVIEVLEAKISAATRLRIRQT
jgi:hypothetical protein